MLGLLLVVGASARRAAGRRCCGPELPLWPLLFVVGAGLVVAARSWIAVAPAGAAAPDRAGAARVRAGPLTVATAALTPLLILALYTTLGAGGHRRNAPRCRTSQPTRSAQPQAGQERGRRGRGVRGRHRGGPPRARGVRGRARAPARARARAAGPGRRRRARRRRASPFRPIRAPPCWPPTRGWRPRSPRRSRAARQRGAARVPRRALEADSASDRAAATGSPACSSARASARIDVEDACGVPPWAPSTDLRADLGAPRVNAA